MQGTYLDFNAFSNNAQYSFGLNNEIAELAPSAYNNPNYNTLLALKRIIGHLPFAEQTALINSISTGTPLFNFEDYFNKIKSGTNPSFTANFFKENNKALSTYLTESEKRLNKGLGCFKKVANDFGFSDRMDEEKMLLISAGINEILAAKTQANFCSVTFLGVLQNIMIKRRAFLFQLNQNQLTSTEPNDFFSYNSNKDVCGIKYINPTTDSSNEVIPLVSAFKEYATCQHSYKNVLHRRAMEIEFTITQMTSCIDRDNPNQFAGNSSTPSISPNITYNSNHEQIGVNNASMIRPDQRTMNNYLLDYGFNLGIPNVQSTDTITLSYPKEFFQSIITAISGLSNPLFTEFANAIKMYYTIQLSNRPFSNLYAAILNTQGIVNDNDKQNLSALLKELNAIAEGKTACAANWMLKCNIGQQCNCTPTDCPQSIKGNIVTLINLQSESNFHFSQIEISVACPNGKSPILFAKGDNKVLGSVFDIHYEGKSLGSLTQSKTQACFGVFTSGMKNDKDACRDPITEKCGTELDYQCKKSGLYDIINESPVTDSPIPYNCTVSNDDCLKWIDKHFILGTIAVKPSAFASFHLALQSSMIEKPFINNRDNYCEVNFYNQVPTSPVTENQGLLGQLSTHAESSLFVHKSSLKSIGNTGMEYVEMNKETYNLHISSGLFTTLNLFSFVFFSFLFL